MSSFKYILLIGATDSIGGGVLSTLETAAPSHLKIITVPDTYPTEALILAFKSQDVIVNRMTSFSVSVQFRIVDALIAVSVSRYVPSEYDLNNARPDAQALNTVFRNRGCVQAYLQSKAEEGMIDMTHSFLGMHVTSRRSVLWDDGWANSCARQKNTALGWVRALLRHEETRNRNLYLSDFAVSQKELLGAIERIQRVEYRVGEMYTLIETGFVTGRIGSHLQMEGEMMNERLELPRKTPDEVVREPLQALVTL
ncbi:uncharacterized protein BCR38DRAFT_460878 [Pseudomassariella vexata]|uniref:Uncharacterized protein n=1 Tax=Pseudomassariella vexata TaxID=1141098 RepID=A0A1Y2DH49_9PEZI|nr:uncharacterized protein BCR38DRAFT_460878 [Pseudomassariella vexata]ORY58568.1 hypothetical protein BCR38DRAFT_460878 [Pseudomassariella vexata]